LSEAIAGSLQGTSFAEDLAILKYLGLPLLLPLILAYC